MRKAAGIKVIDYLQRTDTGDVSYRISTNHVSRTNSNYQLSPTGLRNVPSELS